LLDRMVADGHHGGGPALRKLVMASATRHHKQWSRVSFKISGEKEHFNSNPLKIEIAR
jgi:hypothetical protein